MVQPWPMDPPLSDKDPADPVRGIAAAEHVEKCPLVFFFIFYFLIKKRLMKTISIESLIGGGEGSSSISENAIQVAMSWFVSVCDLLINGGDLN